VEIAKLRDYVLNPEHLRGRHKARVFKASLGFSASDAESVRAALLRAARDGDALPGRADRYGRRYALDCPMAGPAGETMIRSLWIVRRGEDFPRLTSCYVLQ
jgi:hypothetical protein